jgi:MOSC domain-containing protein YiiM
MTNITPNAVGQVVAVCLSPGGIPKRPREMAQVTVQGLVGDGRNHAKHLRLDRAVSFWDLELLEQLVAEGFDLTPGRVGENLTVRGLNVQALPPGTLPRVGDVVLKLEQPRKPCYVLDAIDPRLKEVLVGRCGYMASVVREGILRPGMTIRPMAPLSRAQPSRSQPSQPQIGDGTNVFLAGPPVTS